MVSCLYSDAVPAVHRGDAHQFLGAFDFQEERTSQRIRNIANII